MNVIGTTILNPYVHLLGENSACIAYTRITQFYARFVVLYFSTALQHTEMSKQSQLNQLNPQTKMFSVAVLITSSVRTVKKGQKATGLRVVYMPHKYK